MGFKILYGIGSLCIVALLALSVFLPTNDSTSDTELALTHQCGVDFETDIHNAILIDDCSQCHSIMGSARNSRFLLSKDRSLAGAVYNESVLFNYPEPLEIIAKMNGEAHEGGQRLARTDLAFQRFEYFMFSYLSTEGLLPE